MAKLSIMPKTSPVTIYDRSGERSTKRYYSSSDAVIYFMDNIIDEITQINWTIQQNTLPLFGFNSYTMDHVVQGSRFITGVFAINFTKENYIGELIKSIRESSSGVYTPYIKPEKALYNASMDIYIKYGEENYDSVKSSSFIKLKDVIITTVESSGCDNRGSPVLELYHFIAKDIAYE